MLNEAILIAIIVIVYIILRYNWKESRLKKSVQLEIFYLWNIIINLLFIYNSIDFSDMRRLYIVLVYDLLAIPLYFYLKKYRKDFFSFELNLPKDINKETFVNDKEIGQLIYKKIRILFELFGYIFTIFIISTILALLLFNNWPGFSGFF